MSFCTIVSETAFDAVFDKEESLDITNELLGLARGRGRKVNLADFLIVSKDDAGTIDSIELGKRRVEIRGGWENPCTLCQFLSQIGSPNRQSVGAPVASEACWHGRALDAVGRANPLIAL